MSKQRPCTLVMILLLCASWAFPDSHISKDGDEVSRKTFQHLQQLGWKLVLHDRCTGNWKDYWHLDGLQAKVSTDNEGMVFAAGPTHRNDACHAVLWTKERLKGDIRLDYEYTKLDDTHHNVTILYLQATGSGLDTFDKDIFQWHHLRQVPSMRLYFNHMNTYHISYAAFGMENMDPQADYIRAGRYMPESGKGLRGPDLKPDVLRTGLFKKGVPHQITVIKVENDLFMHVRNEKKQLLCHWHNDSLPPIVEGRIGLRHMYTRSARYRDFRVYLLSGPEVKPVD